MPTSPVIPFGRALALHFFDLSLLYPERGEELSTLAWAAYMEGMVA